MTKLRDLSGPATSAQIKYIEQLCIDCFISSRSDRNEIIYDVIGKEVNYLSELTKSEASYFIEHLRERKEGIRRNDPTRI